MWDEDFGLDEGDDEQSSDGLIDDFSMHEGTEDTLEVGNGYLIRTGLIMVGVGVLILLIGLTINGQISHRSEKNIPINDSENQNSQVVSSPVVPNEQAVNNVTQDGWVEFSGTNVIDFSDEYIDATFTVIQVDNYVKRVSNGNDSIAVKTILTGNISGFAGNFTLEIPYYKGSRLKTGKAFKVQVQHGVYGDRLVIGDIKY